MNIAENGMTALEIEAMTYEIMRRYGEHKVIFNGKETLCVGGVEFDNEHLSLYQDFFNRREIPLFTNEAEEFVANNIESYMIDPEIQDDYEYVIKISRTDGNLYIFCNKPWFNPVDIEVETIWDLCNSEIRDDSETRKIDGVTYNVTNPAMINRDKITNDVYRGLREILDVDEFDNISLMFYFVRNAAEEKFYVGLWDAEHHCPVNIDINGKGNSDYSKIYALLQAYM